MANVGKFYDSVTDRFFRNRGRKARIAQVPGGLEVVIPRFVSWTRVVAAPALILVLFGAQLLRALPPGHGGTAGVVMAGVLALILTLHLAWQLAGVEVITVDGISLIQRIELLGLSWSRRFSLQDVYNLIVFSVPRQRRGSTWREWRPERLRTSIMFQVAGKPQELAGGIDYNDAKRAVEAIRSAYPIVCREN